MKWAVCLMQDKVELALKVATKAHEGQLDKAGNIYIEHPKYVASLVKEDNEKIVALLHDTIEDTTVTFEELEQYGFDKEIIDALKLLTHDSKVKYFDYIDKIKTNELARKVKIADLTHNSDISRIKELTQKDNERIVKYKKALEMLSN